MCARTFQSHNSSHLQRSDIEILLFYGRERTLFERGRQFEPYFTLFANYLRASGNLIAYLLLL